MKNMKKFITLCGFLILGSIACGDADVVKAEAINEQTTDTTGYTITIPSDVDIDKDSGKGSFAVTGKMGAQTELDVSVSSQNGYKLKNKNQEISYSLDKGSFHIDNIKSADMKSFDENFNITLANTNTNYSGNYEDRLTFNIGSNKYTYELDMNSILDGVRENERHNYGAVDVYINGVLKAENVSDFKEILNYGDTYEFKNIKATDGHHFVGVNSCANTSIKGRIGADTNYLEARRDNPYNLVAPIYFEFNTNKLTINYHANGAQTWKTANINNASEIDVTGKDIMETEYTKYNELYDKYDWERHFCSVARIKRDGYTAKSNVWKVGQNCSLEVQDNKILQKAQDVAEYCGVLDEFKKNDTTIDLYPIWTANTYTLTVNPNGGLINGDGSSKALDTKLCFDTGNCWDINYLKPTRKGFEFLGWYDAPENGNIVYDSNGKCINNGNYWKDSSYVNPNNLTVYAQWKKVSYSAGTVLNIEGSDYIVMGQTEDGNYRLISGTSIGNMQYQPNQDSNGNYYDVGKYNENDLPETRYDEQNSNVYEDSYIDKYLESTYYNSLPEKLKKAIVATQIKQASYTNTDMNSKWRLLSKDTNPVSPDGTSNWFYNEGTSENPKYVRYDKVTTPDGDGGVYPLKYWTKKEKGYGEQAYNEITRHVYLPSVEEINNLVDLNNANKTYAFLKGTNNSLNHMWLRDASSISSRDAMILYYDHLSLGNNFVTDPWFGVRPAFVVDLSKIDYTVTGSVNYK